MGSQPCDIGYSWLLSCEYPPSSSGRGLCVPVVNTTRRAAAQSRLGVCLSTPPPYICISVPRYMWLCLCALKYADPSPAGQSGFVMAKHFDPVDHSFISLIEHPQHCEACQSANVVWQYLPIVGEYRYYCCDCPHLWTVHC